MEPEASRPHIPEDYGVPADVDGLLPWSYVIERVTVSKHYWLSTVTPGGAPHTRPIDGFWFDDRLYFMGDPGSRWFRNLTENPEACLNLEDGEQAVILHGRVSRVITERALAVRLAQLAGEKYGFDQSPDLYEGVEMLVFEPTVSFAWKLLYEDATRWRFQSEA